MKTLKFYGLEIVVTDSLLEEEVFDVDFSGQLLVQFTEQEDGSYLPTNAMNGWGDNCYEEIKGQELFIE